MSTVPGSVDFVGAGPGAVDLLTLRAVRALERAQLVLHDALIEPSVLALCKNGRCVSVGKRAAAASTDQRFINRSLVEAARQYEFVVRLKGGDPSIFGRLDEELDALEQAGICYRIIAGVTAASAAAAAAGRSLTRRGVARSLTICTPRVGRGELEDLRWAAGLNPQGTTAIYMAGQRAGAIASVLLRRGYPGSTPVVIARSVSWSMQDIQHTRLDQLLAGLGPTLTGPVVLLVGEALARGEGELRTALEAVAHTG